MNKIIVKSDSIMFAVEQIQRVLEHDTKKGAVQVTIDKVSEGRRNAQNRLLWLWHNELRAHIVDSQGQYFEVDDIHDYIARLLLPVRYNKLNNVSQRAETKKLKVGQFAEFLTEYQAFVAQKYGLLFSQPDDLYFKAVHGASK